MIVRPQAIRVLPPSSALPQSVSSTPSNQAQAPVVLNLKIKQINVDGLSLSERGIFVAAFQARVNALAQAAGGEQLRRRFLQSPHAARIRNIDGGVLPAGLDAKRMGERAANAIFKELLR